MADENQTPTVPATPAQGTPATPPATEPAHEEPKFTQKQLNDLIAKEAGTRESKILERLGVKSADELDAIRKKLDEGKTEEQRKAEALDAEKKRADELDGKYKSSDLIIELLALGMDKENAKKYAKFAAEEAGETAEDKARAFVTSNEGLVKRATVPQNVGRVTGQQGEDKDITILNQMLEKHKKQS
jgi:hypothetical protein